MGRPSILPAAQEPALEVGEGVVATTPPVGIEMAGFHRPLGEERRIEGIRQPTAARALLLRLGNVQAAIVSLDICGVSTDMTRRQSSSGSLGDVESRPPTSAFAKHTPIQCPRFDTSGNGVRSRRSTWHRSKTKIVNAVEMAKADVAPAALYLGKSRAPGASNNRTTKTWKTDEQFTQDSSHEERWLDTMVHVLHFDRGQGKKNLLWYHFAAHPVCYQDAEAGPDWPGLVTDLVREKHHLTPSYLQGHAGDVNAGDADHWIGKAENTAGPVSAAISQAIESGQRVKTNNLRLQAAETPLPLDMKLFSQWLAAYREDPSKCSSGPWVDARFAKEWFEHSEKRDMSQTATRVPLTAMQLGDLGFVFHPSELYSYYGLHIRRDSPLPDTLVIGYCDDIIGYLPDPNAFKSGEYSAITVPKIIDLPPFQPTAASSLAREAIAMLNNVVR